MAFTVGLGILAALSVLMVVALNRFVKKFEQEQQAKLSKGN